MAARLITAASALVVAGLTLFGPGMGAAVADDQTDPPSVSIDPIPVVVVVPVVIIDPVPDVTDMTGQLPPEVFINQDGFPIMYNLGGGNPSIKGRGAAARNGQAKRTAVAGQSRFKRGR